MDARVLQKNFRFYPNGTTPNCGNFYLGGTQCRTLHLTLYYVANKLWQLCLKRRLLLEEAPDIESAPVMNIKKYLESSENQTPLTKIIFLYLIGGLVL